MPGVAVIGAETNRGRRSGAKLMRSFRQMVKEEFFKASRRSITILAVGFSKDGVKWCQRLRLEQKTMVKYADNKWYPLFVKKVTAKDLEDWLDNIADAA